MKALTQSLVVAVLLTPIVSEAQSPNPVSQPAPVQAQPCTPPEVYQHLHIENSKPLKKLLFALGKQIDKSTGGTVSGPTITDLTKTLPPPCPAVPTPPAPKPIPVAPKQ
jgi:hypothetical protein